MARVRMDQEGVNALKTLAMALPQAVEMTNAAAESVRGSFEEKKDVLGSHTDQIEEILEQVKSAQKTGSSSVAAVQVSLIRAAAALAAILQTSISVPGGSSAPSAGTASGGTAGPAGPAATSGTGPAAASGGGTGGYSPMMQGIQSWLGDVNPRYYDPFLPPQNNPYHVNCGSCAFSVYQRLNGGDSTAVASHVNIGRDEEMERVTGKRCTYMSVADIEKILISGGPGTNLIVGINRRLPSGRTISGHWFNAVYDGEKIYTIDGQSGEILDWPHDYGYVSEWCALV